MKKTRFNALAAGFRSGLEKRMADELNKRGIQFEFEQAQIPYFKQAHHHKCKECGSENIYSLHNYHPDFYLPEYGFYIETKGRFLGADRKKHVAIQATTDIDVRFVFQKNDYLTKKKKQTYTGWCDSKGLPYFVIVTKTKKREEQLLPEEWFNG